MTGLKRVLGASSFPRSTSAAIVIAAAHTMRTAVGYVPALAALCLLSFASGDVAHAQIVKPCVGVDADCAISEVPVPGVRIVRPSNYPTDRPAHYMSGDKYTTLAEARETLNRFALVDLFVPPGGGPAPHTHVDEWEIFFILQGSVSFFVDVNPNPPFNVIEREVGAGTAVYAPICRVMGFVNKNPVPARALTFALPAGIEALFHNVGDEVVHYNGPIPPATPEQFLRQAFWGERDGDLPYFPGLVPPPVCSGVPNRVISSITDPGRPRETGPFGETRVVLVTPAEVGATTGATAFCGGGPQGRPGGTAKFSYFSMAGQADFLPSHISQNAETFYVLSGRLSLLLRNSVRTQVDAGTYVEIQPGVPFSLANLQDPQAAPAQALTMSVISPPCQ